MLDKKKRIVDREILDTYHKEPCIACGRLPSDAAHIKSKGSGRDDVATNLIPLCRKCHRTQHNVGWKRMAQRYHSVWIYLAAQGWYFDERGQGRIRLHE